MSLQVDSCALEMKNDLPETISSVSCRLLLPIGKRKDAKKNKIKIKK